MKLISNELMTRARFVLRGRGAYAGEYKPWTKHGRNMDDPWINVSITGCAYRAELLLGR